MPQSNQAKLLRLHFSESDKHSGEPLHEAIVAKCRDLNIAGATVFRGLEGYGETAEIHKHHVAAHDQPIVVVIADSAENIDRLVPIVEEMMRTGTIAISKAEMIRIEKSGAEHPV